MRRFISYVAVAASTLVPAVASAQASGPNQPVTGGAAVGQGPAGNAGATNNSGAGGGGLSDRGAPAAAPAPAARPAPLPWRGSAFIFDQSVSWETLVPSSQQSMDPSYQWWMSFRPRWALTRTLSFRARLDMTLEWANSETTTRFREPQFGDLWTDVLYTGLPRLAGIGFAVGGRVQWPLSLASRARGTYFTLGAIVAANRGFELGRAGSLSVGLAFVGSRPFTSHTSGGILGQPYPCSGSDFYEVRSCTTLGGMMNVAFSLATMFTLGWETPVHGLSVSTMYLLSNQWVQQTPDVQIVDQMGGTTTIPRSPDDNRMRQSSWFLVSADYEAASWLSVSGGYYVFRPILDPNGTYGNPFWSPGQNTRVFVTMTVPLDALYMALRGGRGTGEAQNTRGVTMNDRPRRRFSPNDAARQLREQQMQSGTFF